MDNSEEVLKAKITHEINSASLHLNEFKNEIENKNVIACLGNTRGGKSTLVNFILNTELIAYENHRQMCIKEKNYSNAGPMISHGTLSYTKFPSVWNVPGRMDTVIVDMPGFEDNRGVPQNIINTLFFNQLKHADTVRLVLVCDINDIVNDNINSFLHTIAKFQNIIESDINLLNSVCMIFTKDHKNFTEADMANMLRCKILDVDQLQAKKEIVRYIVRNSNAIGILKKPIQEGSLTKADLSQNVEKAIFNSQGVHLHLEKLVFTLSYKEQHQLLNLCQNTWYTVNLEEQIKRVLVPFLNYFEIDTYVFASTEEELEQTKIYLNQILIRVSIQRTKTITKLIDLLESLQCVMIRNLQYESFGMTFDFLRLMDDCQLLGKEIKKDVLRKFEDGLRNLDESIRKVLHKIECEMADREKLTINHALNEAMSDRNKIVLFGATWVPLVKNALTAAGIECPNSIQVVPLSNAAYGLAGAAAVGALAGGAGITYYKTIRARVNLRQEQGR